MSERAAKRQRSVVLALAGCGLPWGLLQWGERSPWRTAGLGGSGSAAWVVAPGAQQPASAHGEANRGPCPWFFCTR